MNELKDKLIALGQSIVEERKDILKVQKSVTDDILKDCIAVLSGSYTHVHDLKEEPMLEKERELMFMAHARHALIRKGHLQPDSDSLKYLTGYMDGQRKLFAIATNLSLALRRFQAAHPCTDADGVTCPTHRAAKEAVNEFEEWMSPELAQPVS